MRWSWIRENPPHWDEGKLRILAAESPSVFDLGSPARGATLPGEWWRVEEAGRTIGYGWMDTTWGEGEILLAVDPAERRRGVGSFILAELVREARAAGLNYLHNVVRPGHPEREQVIRWLGRHGFRDSGDGRLRRRLGPEPGGEGDG